MTATQATTQAAPSASATLTERIRSACSELHTRIERLPYPVDLLAGRVSRDRYRTVLAQLHHVHAGLESHLAARPELAEWAGPEFRRADLIVGDLRALGLLPAEAKLTGASLSEILPLNAPAKALLTSFGRFANGEPSSPWPLLGALYIYEGSRMGSMMLATPLARGLGVPVQAGAGLDYHLDGADSRPRAWRAFKARLDNLPVASEIHEAVSEAVLAAAVETMQGTYRLYESFAA